MDTRLQDNLDGMQHDYMAPFLWLHGEEDSLILNELQRIYDSGIRSVCLESRTHEDFAGEGWWSDVRLIMEECRKKDMKVWILDDKHFPSGYANGAFEKAENAHLRPWGITERHIDISGPVEEGCAMADAWKWAEEDTIVGVLACKHVPDDECYTEVVDITDGLQNGMVYFSLPEGMWRILFLIKTRSGTDEHNQYYCDMLDASSVRVFVDEVYEKHYEHLQEYFGNTFLGFFSDEPCFRNGMKFSFAPELGKHFEHHPWHDKMMKALEAEVGEDARKMLAGLWFQIEGGISEKIRYAFMDIVTRQYSENFCNQLADWCHEHGVMYIGHVIEDNGVHTKTGASIGHYFRALKGQDMSGVDVVLHQIIPGLTECSNAGDVCYEHMENKFYHYYLAKLGSSLAHMDAKKKGRAMCEIFGAFGWAEGTRFMKYLADHMLVRGINYFVPHAFSPKLNDPDCPPNFYDSGENALYKYFRDIMDYMNRVCYLHNDGLHVPTAAILYDAEAHWVNRSCVPLEDAAKELYDHLLDYDILPADVLEQIDGDGCLNGEKYPCLIVPYYEGMPEIIVEKLKKVALRTIFVTMPGMEIREACFLGACDKQFEVAALSELADYVREQVGADVTSDYEGIYLRYYHYVREGVHSYMFSNEDINHTIKAKVRMSAFEGGDYILYDAMENRAFAGYSADGEIEIELPPYNTVFVMCGDITTEGIPALTCGALRNSEIGNSAIGNAGITVAEERVLAPEFVISCAEEKAENYTYYKTTDQLCNITGRNELPYFSGNIKYEGVFAIEGFCGEESDAEAGCAAGAEAPVKYLLDLGSVGEAAEVFVNGMSVGRKLIPPYTFDISKAVQEGDNKLTVIVSNHSGYQKRDGFSRYLLFEPSGLLGPVTLKKIK